VSATLRGAAADTDARERLRRGRLIEEHAAPGFEAFAGMAPAGRREPATPPSATGEEPQHREPRAPQPSRAHKRAAEREARASEREARIARIRAATLERDGTRLRQRVEKSAKAVERLRERLREAEARLAQQRQAANQAAEETE